MKSFPLLLALMLAGCASLPPAEIAQSHPANPKAMASVYPPLKPILVTATNTITTDAKPAASEHQHDHK